MKITQRAAKNLKIIFFCYLFKFFLITSFWSERTVEKLAIWAERQRKMEGTRVRADTIDNWDERQR